MESFFTLYGINVLGIDAGDGSCMLTTFAAALIVFAIPSGLITTKIGQRPTITIGLVRMMVGLIIGFLIRNQTALLILLDVMGASGHWSISTVYQWSTTWAVKNASED